MTLQITSPEDLAAAIGRPLGPTDWIPIEQDRIDKFAEATGDFQWIHVDVARAATGPFGGTIAHGYLTLSLVAFFGPQLFTFRNMFAGVNYGCEKVRFPSPVRAGSRLRGHGEILSVARLEPSVVQAVNRITIELEGSEKPACVAETVGRYYFTPPA